MSIKDKKSIPCYTRIPTTINNMIMESGLLHIYSRSQILQMAIIKGLPTLIEIKEDDKSKIGKLWKVCDNHIERDIARFLKNEHISKAYFLRRFMFFLNKLLRDKIARNDLLKILDAYRNEGKTYENNLDAVNIIESIIDYIENNEDMQQFHSYLEMKMSELNRIVYSYRKNEKTNNN